MLAEERPRLGDGQMRSLADLYVAHSDRMVRMAARALPLASRADAQDIVQAVFTEAVAAGRGSPPEAVGEGWLFCRLRSRILDHYRRASRQRRLLEAIVAAESPPSVEELAVDDSTVEEYLSLIPDATDRQLLRLKLSGYREAEIARHFSLRPENRNVRDRMRRIRNRVSARQRDGQPPPSVRAGPPRAPTRPPPGGDEAQVSGRT